MTKPMCECGHPKEAHDDGVGLCRAGGQCNYDCRDVCQSYRPAKSLALSGINEDCPNCYKAEKRGFINGQADGLALAIRQAELSTRPLEIHINKPNSEGPEPGPSKALTDAELDWFKKGLQISRLDGNEVTRVFSADKMNALFAQAKEANALRQELAKLKEHIENREHGGI